ncbi:MAG: c-type cytochrome domain-containing protein [Thermoanaerobaculia bacterium]
MNPAWLALASWMAAAPGEPPLLAFEKDVLPILDQRCTECHGISKQSGGLRLDGLQELLKGSRKGPVVSPGKSAESRIVERVTAEGKRRMPPKGDRVPPAEVEIIRRWIDAGARSSPAAARAPSPEPVQLARVPPSFAPVLAVAGNRQGSRLAVGRGAAVEVLRAENGGWKSEVVLEGSGDLVQCLAFSPDGALLAAGGYREVLLWESGGWKLKRALPGFLDRVLAIDFSPSGDLLAAGGGLPTQSGEVQVWQPRTGKLMRRIPDPHTDTVLGLDFSPDGERVATGAADKMVHLFELGSARRLARFEGHTHHVLAVAFSPDGKRLLSAGAEGKIKSWNLEKSESKDWNGHGKAVTALAFSPDGKFAASASGDRTLRIWNPENGGQVRAHGEARDYLYALALFGEGKLLAAAGRDPVVRVYTTAEAKLVYPSPSP